MNEFELIVAYKKLPTNIVCKTARWMKKISALLELRTVSSMLPEEKGEELSQENYYSLAYPEDPNLPALLVVEDDVVSVDRETFAVQHSEGEFGSELLGVATFKDVLVLFFRTPRIDFYTMKGGLKKLWSTEFVQILYQIPDWFIFSEKYRITKHGELYFVGNEKHLWKIDLTLLDELKAKDENPFQKVDEKIVDVALSPDTVDVYYLSEDGTLKRNSKTLFQIEWNENIADHTLVSLSAKNILVSLTSQPESHTFQLRSLKGTILDSHIYVFKGDEQGCQLKNISHFEYQGISMFVMTTYWTHAYIFGVNKNKLHLLKAPFSTGVAVQALEEDPASFTNNCTLVRQAKRSVEIIFVGYPCVLSSLKF